MDDDDNITVWIKQLSLNDDSASTKIWEAYFEKLVAMAKRRLGSIPKRVADEEDVALSALNSFFHAAKRGQFDSLDGRDELWKLLVTITARKATKQLRRQLAQKRGQSRVSGESIFQRKTSSSDDKYGIDQIADNEPTPEFTLSVAENCVQLLDNLENESLRSVARLKLEGYSNKEIATELDCAERSVERKIVRIREKWSRSSDEDDSRDQADTIE